MAENPPPAPQKIIVKEDDIPDYELARTRTLPLLWQYIVVIATLIAVGLAMNQIFAWRFFIGHTIIEAQYLYAVVAIMFAMVFVVFPAYKRQNRSIVPWYDALMFVTSLVVGAYAVWYSDEIVDQAWEYASPLHGKLVAVVMWGLVLEAGRRTGGWPIFFVVLVLSTYPIYVHLMPEVISGVPQTPLNTAAFHMFSIESLLGIPMPSLRWCSASSFSASPCNTPAPAVFSSIWPSRCSVTSAAGRPRWRCSPPACSARCRAGR